MTSRNQPNAMGHSQMFFYGYGILQCQIYTVSNESIDARRKMEELGLEVSNEDWNVEYAPMAIDLDTVSSAMANVSAITGNPITTLRFTAGSVCDIDVDYDSFARIWLEHKKDKVNGYK